MVRIIKVLKAVDMGVKTSGSFANVDRYIYIIPKRAACPILDLELPRCNPANINIPNIPKHIHMGMAQN